MNFTYYIYIKINDDIIAHCIYHSFAPYLSVKVSTYTFHLQTIIGIYLYKYNTFEFYSLDNVLNCSTITTRKGVISMPTISVYFSESEYNLVSQHVKSKRLTISQYIKTILLEEIEDEYDVSIVNEYLQEKDSMKFLPFEEAIKEWNIK